MNERGIVTIELYQDYRMYNKKKLRRIFRLTSIYLDTTAIFSSHRKFNDKIDQMTIIPSNVKWINSRALSHGMG